MTFTTRTTRIETFDLGHGSHLNEPSRELVRGIATITFSSLDHAERELRLRFPGWFVYRGGSHVALHRTDGGARVLIVEERVAPTFTLADTHDIIATGLSEEEAHDRLVVIAAELVLALHIHRGGWAGTALSTAYRADGDCFLDAVAWVRVARPGDTR